MKRIHCPIHKKEELRRLLYHMKVKNIPRSIYPDLFFCISCNKPYKFTFQISEALGDKI